MEIFKSHDKNSIVAIFEVIFFCTCTFDFLKFLLSWIKKLISQLTLIITLYRRLEKINRRIIFAFQFAIIFLCLKLTLSHYFEDNVSNILTNCKFTLCGFLLFGKKFTMTKFLLRIYLLLNK